jgi:bifunctional ADP-heptose synthase (sugar kinase/adenylyltransferase)
VTDIETSPRPSAPLVLCVGIAVVDFMFRVDRFPTASTKAMAREFFLTGGGNAATAIARLGGRARFCGPVGDDEFGERVLDGLVKEAVLGLDRLRQQRSRAIAQNLGQRIGKKVLAGRVARR